MARLGTARPLGARVAHAAALAAVIGGTLTPGARALAQPAAGAAASSAASTAPAPPPPASAAPSAPTPAPAPSAAAPAAPPAPPPTPPPAPAAPAAADATAPAPPVETARVHVGSDYPDTALQLRSLVDQDDWRTACVAPCDQVLHVAGAEARVVAPGMSPSNVFRLEPGRGTAGLRVSGGSAEARTWGVVGFASGLPVALAGFGLYGFGVVQDREGFRTAGGVTIGVGAAVVLTSLILLGQGGTEVRDHRGKTIARRAPRSVW